MSLVRIGQRCAILILAIGVSSSKSAKAAPPASSLPSTLRTVASAPSEIQQPFAIDNSLPGWPEPASGDARDSLATESGTELSLPRLIDEVQTRNPSLQAMVAAWQAAAQRYPQVISLDDPMFMAMGAPASFGSDQVEGAYAVQLNQKFPWFGKRAARGRQATAEASAALHDFEDSRVQLADTTRNAYFDYYLATRKLELNQQNVELIREFRDTAQARYSANQVTQQDVLQATLELVQQDRRRLELERTVKVAVARINTLLLKDPFSPLPPPPQQLDPPLGQLDAAMLQQLALSQRPDLAALAERVRADEAAVTLACKDYYPDMEVFGRYDTFWQPASTQSDLRPQVGITVNVPIYRGRLNAAVREALFKLSQDRAQLQQRQLDVQYDVATTYEQEEESRSAWALYTERLLPTAEDNVSSARTNYSAGKVTYLELATALRQLVDVREKVQESSAEYHSRMADLERAAGGSIPAHESIPNPPPEPSNQAPQ
jgi:outer membrane protein TolC